jgi:hypothetical protein
MGAIDGVSQEEYRLFENGLLRRIFATMGEDMQGGWRKLHNVELYSSLNIIGMIGSRRMRWARHRPIGFEVLTAVSKKMAVFWVVAPCSLVEV